MISLAETMELIKQAVNPDKAPDALNQLTENIKELYTTNETLSNSVSSMQGQIQDLRDTNMKLFLSQTREVEKNEPEPEKTPDDYLTELVERIRKDNEGSNNGEE